MLPGRRVCLKPKRLSDSVPETVETVSIAVWARLHPTVENLRYERKWGDGPRNTRKVGNKKAASIKLTSLDAAGPRSLHSDVTGAGPVSFGVAEGMKPQPYNWSWIGWCLLAWAVIFFLVSSSIDQGYFTTTIFGVECGFARIKSSTLWIYGGEFLRPPFLSPMVVLAIIIGAVVFGSGLYLKTRRRGASHG